MHRASLAMATVLLLLPGAAFAQEKADNPPLPPICTSGGTGMAMSSGGMKAGEAKSGGMSAGGAAMSDMKAAPAGDAAAGVAAAEGAAAGDAAAGFDEAHQAMMAGMDKMQTDMMAGMAVSDIDVAFVCGMIPHHQGAIAMARAELKYGKDPENQKLANAIIAAQEKEVTEMLAWLEKHGK